ncbi:MAG: hypothetical protein ABIR18_01620 [Chitinophagaceae bacterium]
MYSRFPGFIKYVGIFFFQLICCDAFSQQSTNGPIIEKFKSYSNTAIQEKLFLHTDKEFYIAGEIVWFKIYYVDGVSNLPMQMSKLAYAEVLNSNNEPVLQAKISLEEATGKGAFYLPGSLTTGNYSIRAYTNWMKNFDANYFFEKKITVVNTLKTPESSSKDSASMSLELFPEGGNLVSEIMTKVGFIVTGNKGGENNFRGYIVNQNNDTITSFAPLKFGVGHFYFKPEQGQSYKAIVTTSTGAALTKSLPEIFSSGYVMNVTEVDGQKIRVALKLKRASGEENTQGVLLAVHKRQSLSMAEKAFITNNDSAVLLIDKNKLTPGVNYFTLFNTGGKPVCERLIYLPPANSGALDIKTDQGSYANRQKINVGISSNQHSKTDPLNLSVSVFYTDNLQGQEQLMINDYMWLTSDLAGVVESPSYYFSKDPDVKEATDNLLLTHGWRRFKWENVLQGGNSFIKYLPEINGHIITGRVKDSRNDKPVSNSTTFLSIPGRPFGFYTAESDKDGIVYFETKKFYGNGHVIAQTGNETDSFYKAEVIKPYAETVSGYKYPAYTLTEEVKEQLLRKSIGMQVQNIYSGDSLRSFYEPGLTDTLPFYGTPEATYLLDDYKRFTTMEEVLREYVREVGVGSRGERLIFKLFNPVAHDFYDGNTLVLLNGVALPNPDKIFSYDPLKVRKIDVLRGRYVLGQSTFNGVTSFSTYDGSFAAYELEPKLIAVDYSGLQLEREFYSPAYATKEQLEKRIPDFRNTLLWSPDVHTNADGKTTLQFYSSDLKGKYTVVVQGMSEKGTFVSGTSTFEVK